MKIGETEFTLASSKTKDAKDINKDLSELIYRASDQYLYSISDELNKHESLFVDVKIDIRTEVDDE